ncbi:MAG: hypothetical protein HN932_12990 [Candidatus Marinimicrobia bacterium]|jgi:hypothetical protein|nr:hypothetical protein [Candidatus Neomarinimicrobiota bacterium]
MKEIAGWLLAGALLALMLPSVFSPYKAPILDSSEVVTHTDTMEGEIVRVIVPGPVRWLRDTVYVDSSGDSLASQVVQSDTVEVTDGTFVSAQFFAERIFEPRGFKFDYQGKAPDTIKIKESVYILPDGLVVQPWMAYTALGLSAIIGYKIGD